MHLNSLDVGFLSIYSAVALLCCVTWEQKLKTALRFRYEVSSKKIHLSVSIS